MTPDPIDCGEGPAEGLAGMPKVRRGLALWMREFDRVKVTPLGSIEAKIVAVRGGGLTLILSLGDLAVSRDWPARCERRYTEARIIELVMSYAEGARLQLLYLVATRRAGFRQGGKP